MNRSGGFLLILFLGLGFLLVRKIFDRGVEKITDSEVVRENEEYLGSWASKSDKGLVLMRLHRNGVLNYTTVAYPSNDSIIVKGSYKYVSERNNDRKYFPRLYAFKENGDTIFNYYVRYLTKYDMTIDKVDKMEISPNSVYDTVAFTFYRIKK